MLFPLPQARAPAYRLARVGHGAAAGRSI